MGIGDKAKNKLQQAAGQAKKQAGRATDNPDLRAEGQADQTAGGLKQSGEKLKGAAKNARDAFKS